MRDHIELLIWISLLIAGIAGVVLVLVGAVLVKVLLA